MDHAIPSRLNGAIIAHVIAFNLAALFLLPLALTHSLAWALLLFPLAWVNSTHWGLIHEAIHKILLPDAQENERMGRLLSILMGASFHVLRFGHLMHHQLNRDWHSELQDSKTLRGRASYYWHLVFGLYFSELATSIAMAILPKDTFMHLARRTIARDYPDVAIAGERFFYIRGNIRALRHDMAAMFLIYTAAFYVYGAFWPVLLGFIFLRALVISFLDNIYHYGTPADNSKAGKELTLPAAVSRLLLHSNYHETHHLNPLVPWAALPLVHAEQGRGFDGAFLRHGMIQFAGP